jgi:hypothetical protein
MNALSTTLRTVSSFVMAPAARRDSKLQQSTMRLGTIPDATNILTEEASRTETSAAYNTGASNALLQGLQQQLTTSNVRGLHNMVANRQATSGETMLQSFARLRHTHEAAPEEHGKIFSALGELTGALVTSTGRNPASPGHIYCFSEYKAFLDILAVEVCEARAYVWYLCVPAPHRKVVAASHMLNIEGLRAALFIALSCTAASQQVRLTFRSL